jgi:uncharacterized sulfatase
MDALAQQGVMFEHAYAAAPSCSPSRAALLPGQDVYRLREGGVLTGYIREQYAVFPRLLEQSGYAVGSTGKPYWPRTAEVDGAHVLPAGDRWTDRRVDPPSGLSTSDYAGNFEDFLASVPDDAPFFFWVGIQEPHLPHPTGRGLETGIDTAGIRVPAFYPDSDAVRSGLADYLAEIEWADASLQRVLDHLDASGRAENTLIVFTSDNGMPFPRAKATLYDHGVRMPLIMRWDGMIDPGTTVSNPVSLIDLAPTFLDLAGVPIPDQVTGRSIGSLLRGSDPSELLNRDFVVTTFEKHTLARPDSMGYPRRAVHTAEWTYIRNYEPDRWPAGNADYFVPGWDFYGDIDPSGIKSHFLDRQHSAEMASLFELGFGRVPAEELYDKTHDPDMIENLASHPDYEHVLSELREKLEAYLIQTSDPRASGLSPWDDYNLDK